MTARKGKISFSSGQGEGGGSFGRFVVTLFLLAVIVLVFIAIAVRLEAGRAMIEDHLARMAGMNISIESARIALPYKLVLENVVTQGFEPGSVPGFAVREARLGLVPGYIWDIELKGGSLYLLQDEDGKWSPDVLARLGDLPLGNVSDITGLTLNIRRRVRLTIKDATVKWQSNTGLGALAHKINFEMSRIKVPGQVMFYYCLSVYNTVDVDGTRRRNIGRVWLASATDDYVEVSRQSGDKDNGAGGGFWDKETGEQQ